jgi:hypothetical protein
VASNLGLNPSDRSVLQDIGNLLVKHPNEFCTEVLKQANFSPGNSIVIDGIRHKQILDELAVQVQPATLILVYVEATEQVIESRLKGEGALPPNIIKYEQDPTESQVTSVLPNFAGITIQNNVNLTADQIKSDLLPMLIAEIHSVIVNGSTKVSSRESLGFGGYHGVIEISDDFDEPIDYEIGDN